MGKPLNNDNVASFRLPLVEPMKKKRFVCWFSFRGILNIHCSRNLQHLPAELQLFFGGRPQALGKLCEQVNFRWQSVCGSGKSLSTWWCAQYAAQWGSLTSKNGCVACLLTGLQYMTFPLRLLNVSCMSLGRFRKKKITEGLPLCASDFCRRWLIEKLRPSHWHLTNSIFRMQKAHSIGSWMYSVRRSTASCVHVNYLVIFRLLAAWIPLQSFTTHLGKRKCIFILMGWWRGLVAWIGTKDSSFNWEV